MTFGSRVLPTRRGKIKREIKREKKKIFAWEEHKKEESSNKDYRLEKKKTAKRELCVEKEIKRRE